MAPSTFVWTDRETELLLDMILDYKVDKAEQKIDWESCQSKHVDISRLFCLDYPTETSDEFPHAIGELTLPILTAKIKAIRETYHMAVYRRRRRGLSRFALLFLELCELIWGDCSATKGIPSGIETSDLVESLPSPLTSSSSTVDSSASDKELESSAKAQLQAKLKEHQHKPLKRKRSAETQWLNALEENNQMNKRLIDLLENSERRAAENYAKITSTLNTLTTTISEGISLLRQVLQPLPAQPAHYVPYEARGHAYPPTPLQSAPQNSPYVRGTQEPQDQSQSSSDNVPYTRALFNGNKF